MPKATALAVSRSKEKREGLFQVYTQTAKEVAIIPIFRLPSVDWFLL